MPISGFGQVISVSHASGRYEAPFYLKIECNAELRYTLSGNTPRPNSKLFPDSLAVGYVMPPNKYCLIPTNNIEYHQKNWRNREFGWREPLVEIGKLNVIRVAGFVEGRRVTDLLTLVYHISADKVKLPIVAITTDSSNLFDEEIGIYVPGVNYDTEDPNNSGNYCMKGAIWERPASFHFFQADGSLGISQEIGIRIHGGATRMWPQKTLRIYARDKYYDDSFSYPFFGRQAPQEYKRLILRSSMSHWHERNTVFQDEYLHKLIGSFYPDLDVQLSCPAELYLNGEHWGMIAIKERIDEYYLASHHDISPEEILLVEPAEDWDADFDNLIKFCRYQDLNNEVNYRQLEDWMDIPNFARYIILELFLANLDWPHNNYKVWKPTTGEGKWKWILFDLDACLGNANELSITDLASSETPIGKIFNGLIQNEDFVELLRIVWIEMRDELFKLDRMGPLLSDFIDDYKPGIESQINRWQNPANIDVWNNNINEMFSFLLERPRIFENQLNEFFDWHKDDKSEESFEANSQWKVYPNPVNEILTIESKVFFQTNWMVQIISSQGRVLFEKESLGESEMKFQMANLPAGVYIVRIFSNIYQASYQIFKQHKP